MSQKRDSDALYDDRGEKIGSELRYDDRGEKIGSELRYDDRGEKIGSELRYDDRGEKIGSESRFYLGGEKMGSEFRYIDGDGKIDSWATGEEMSFADNKAVMDFKGLRRADSSFDLLDEGEIFERNYVQNVLEKPYKSSGRRWVLKGGGIGGILFIACGPVGCLIGVAMGLFLALCCGLIHDLAMLRQKENDSKKQIIKINHLMRFAEFHFGTSREPLQILFKAVMEYQALAVLGNFSKTARQQIRIFCRFIKREDVQLCLKLYLDYFCTNWRKMTKSEINMCHMTCEVCVECCKCGEMKIPQVVERMERLLLDPAVVRLFMCVQGMKRRNLAKAVNACGWLPFADAAKEDLLPERRFMREMGLKSPKHHSPPSDCTIPIDDTQVVDSCCEEGSFGSRGSSSPHSYTYAHDDTRVPSDYKLQHFKSIPALPDISFTSRTDIVLPRLELPLLELQSPKMAPDKLSSKDHLSAREDSIICSSRIELPTTEKSAESLPRPAAVSEDTEIQLEKKPTEEKEQLASIVVPFSQLGDSAIVYSASSAVSGIALQPTARYSQRPLRYDSEEMIAIQKKHSEDECVRRVSRLLSDHAMMTGSRREIGHVTLPPPLLRNLSKVASVAADSAKAETTTRQKKRKVSEKPAQKRLFKSFTDMVNFDVDMKHQTPIGLYEFDFLLEKEAHDKDDPAWEQVLDQDSIKLYKLSSQDNPVVLIKVFAKLSNIPVVIAAHHIQHFATRIKWDNTFNDMMLLERDLESCEVLYCSFKAPWPIANRDFLQWRRTIENHAEGSVYIMQRSAAHPSMPEKPNYIRAETIISGYILRPLTEDPHKSCMLSIVAQTDIKGLVPSFMVNAAAQRSPVQWVNNLTKACHAYIAKNGTDPPLK